MAQIARRDICQTPCMNIILEDCFDMTQNQMERHMQTLVESLSQRWAHYPAGYGMEFLSIKAEIDDYHESSEYAPRVMDGRFRWGRANHSGRVTHRDLAGFSSSLTIGNEYVVSGEWFANTINDSPPLWYRYYPCWHVPFEMTSAQSAYGPTVNMLQS